MSSGTGFVAALVELNRHAADVFGGVAHYLVEFGWQRGLPTFYEVAAPVDPAERVVLLGPDILPTFSAREVTEHRARLLANAALGVEGKLALIELQNGDAAPSYVAGTTNFYAVTRYNRSSCCAMAVIALGEAVRRQLPTGPGARDVIDAGRAVP